MTTCSSLLGTRPQHIYSQEMQASPYFQPTTSSSPHLLMSAYAQPNHTTSGSSSSSSSSGSFSPLHFPLSSATLHIPPSLHELDTPTSNGFKYGLVRRDRTRQSSGRMGMERRDSAASVETLPEGTLSRPYDLAEDTKFMSTSVQRTPTSYFHGAAYTAAGARRPLTTANLLLRRSSSLLSLTSPEHDEHHRLPELSRTNSVTTCSSEGGNAGMLKTPPHIPFEDFEVLSEEDEQQQEDGDVFFTSSSSLPLKALNSHQPISQESSKPVVIHASPPPTLLKRPGLPRRDTPIPSAAAAAASSHTSSSNVAINKPSKSFRTSLSPVPASIPVPKAAEPWSWSTVATTSTGSGKPQRPTLKRRDTPRPISRPVAQFTTFTTPTSFISSAVAAAAPVSQDERTGITGRSMNVPNFFSTSLRLSLRASPSPSRDGDAVVVVQQDEEEEEIAVVDELPTISIPSSCSEESFTSYAYSPTTLPAPIRKYVVGSVRAVKRLRSSGRGGRERERSFSSVLDGKVWVAV